MTKKLILTIDLGSSGMLSSVFDTDGKLIGEHKRGYTPDTDASGKATYDIEAMLDYVVASLNDLFGDRGINANDVAIVGVSGMMGGVVGVDKNGRATFPYTTTLDTRYIPHYLEMVEAHGPEIREIAGTWYPTLAPKLKWMQAQSPERFAKTVKVVPVTSFFAGRLTGLSPDHWAIDKSLLWMTGLSDAKTQSWSDTLVRKLDVDPALLPDVANSGDIVGNTGTEIANRTPLPEGIPVIAGVGDTPASIVGAGGVGEGVAVDVAGTYPIFSVSTGQDAYARLGKTGEVFGSSMPGVCHPSVFVNGGGLTQKWIADLMFGEADNQVSNYEKLTGEADSISPGSDGLLCNPHFGGRACPPDPNVTSGSFVGLNWGHRRAHMYRAFLESLVYDLSQTFGELTSDIGCEIKELRGVSGMANNPLWNQMKADILNVPYLEMENKEATAVGTAVTAGVSAGLFDSFEEAIAKMCKIKRMYQPRNDIHKAYQPYVQAYRELINS